MTDEELELKAKESFNNKLQKDVCYCTYNEEKIYKDGYIAGAKENQLTVEEMLKRLVKGGYVKSGIRNNKEYVFWHDLRKNPKDLPPKDVGTFSTFVITNKGIGYYVDCQNKWCVYWNVTGSYECSTEVVAWCELPKFKE